ncbi:alpha/beta hydrolase [Corynebacterium terpenotabidum]|uniref:Lipase/esterase n=1 Tax=Corynebacterium terpenotabidum Y-11 TaxID=1200352 RepID=S4XCN8_9CORY|nr:alpha/beta hydrolase [Corynebacterium terpenotabidum]AGP30356.1 lipase/esterase [Corynebacterium terpenotabidum Y-11]
MHESVNTGAEEFRPTIADRMFAGGARRIGLIPPALLRPLARRNADGERLDGDVAASLFALTLVGEEEIAEQTAVEARRTVDRQAYLAGSGGPGALAVGSVTHREIAGVRVRVYTPEGYADTDPAGPAFFYVHGGGFVTGSLDSHDSTCRYLCNRGGLRVFSIDYRMAPEHPYPVPLEDVAAVVSAALAGQVSEVDPKKVVLGGDSAGGYLSAATCLWLRQRNHPQPALQVLLVPVTDQRDIELIRAERASRREFAAGPYLPECRLRWYDEAFLGDMDAAARENPLVSPVLAEDLTGLAPAVVSVAGHDPLRDEGEAYARRLAEAGVPVTLRRHGGLVHPFANSTVIWRGSRRALDEVVGAVRAAVGII